MAELLTDTSHPSNFSLGDVFYALFKHKGKILLGAIAGIIAAITVYTLYTPVYQSSAKLLVRYVVDRSMVDPEAAGSMPKLAENMLASEIEILTSWDLAMDVVDAIGVKRLLPGADATAKTEAAGVVTGGLKVLGSGNIIFVAYTNSDPELATLVLSELVNRYFNKHLEVHRSAGAFDFVTQQTDQVKARLTETEDALRALKAKAGIISLTDSYAALSANLIRVDDAIHNTEEEISEQRARVAMMEQAEQAAAKETAEAEKNKPRLATSGEGQKYQALVGKLASLHQAELELLARYTAENQFVKMNQVEIKKLEAQRADMEKRFPELAASRDGKEGVPVTLAGERARILGLEMKLEALKNRLTNVRGRVNELSEMGSQIADLERTQELQVNSYRYFKNTLEKARVDETLDPSKIPNISAVQRPTPPQRVYGKRDKMVFGLAGGGLGATILLVLLSELIIHTGVKRPLELERRLGVPLLLSIPFHDKGRKKRWRLLKKPAGANGNGSAVVNGASQMAPWEADHFIRPYAVAIRDRLGLYFELNRMTHKPKLVGVTGFSEGSGTSTLAAGLASALSEMGEGKVLLVDVNLGSRDVHPFFNGRPALSLNNALQTNGHENAAAAENLYLAQVAQPNDGPAQLGLKKFFDMMPNLKASDFDYIIFDMPPLGQTSPTIGMAGFMDKVLLVVEAEKNGRDAVSRGFEALTSQRDNVSVVFNKARTYVPKWLNGDS
ncbi:MAG: Wzz/FepE/Etk N-terminal domain-containing protein [Verrucomicrobiota bacterium]|nr:Wzz/FepE/Etk N-terminal domain-containing protein [Verrucomicrobiota bacterium]